MDEHKPRVRFIWLEPEPVHLEPGDPGYPEPWEIPDDEPKGRDEPVDE